ncbi:hypothetical protein [Streptomyces bacillaris]|uniref:hypothetical protein n=1 Tax=Streptomyces bacillaris TaxID=68179 RepID=UPI0034617ADA
MSSADVTDLLASIDDALAASAPVPAAAPAPAPAPVPSAPAGGGQADWWDSLYGGSQGGAQTAPAKGVSQVSGAPRLPYWWETGKAGTQAPAVAPAPAEAPRVGGAEPADTGDTAVSAPGACGHERVVLLHPEGSKEVVGRRCLECDEGVAEAAPEPEECEHAERLEARAEESGKLIGYVCAAKDCGVRLTKEEVHGRLGKWLRPAQGYYPRPRNPLSPGPDGEPPKRAVSAGTLRLLANAGAAGAGYFLGLAPMFGTWIEECARTTSIGGGLFLGGSICLAIGHFWDRRTRHWYPGLAWAARIPLASAVTALALYAPASQI